MTSVAICNWLIRHLGLHWLTVSHWLLLHHVRIMVSIVHLHLRRRHLLLHHWLSLRILDWRILNWRVLNNRLLLHWNLRHRLSYSLSSLHLHLLLLLHLHLRRWRLNISKIFLFLFFFLRFLRRFLNHPSPASTANTKNNYNNNDESCILSGFFRFIQSATWSDGPAAVSINSIVLIEESCCVYSPKVVSTTLGLTFK